MYTDPYPAGMARGATRADHAHAELKRLLLQGDFPLNVRLAEERLAAAVGMSRTPVREALFRLHAEGLVERWPDGGFRPLAPDVAVMHDLYEVRRILELAALRLPGAHGATHDRDALVGLREDWEGIADPGGEPDPGFVAMDESFHVLLAEAAGNLVLADELRAVNERIRLVRMQDFLVDGRISETVREHVGVLDALLGGEVEGAAALLTAHIDRSVVVVEDRVRAAVTRMALSAGTGEALR